MSDIHRRLAAHLENLVMGYPFSDALVDLLREMFDPAEAEVALGIPNNLKPLEVAGIQEIADRCKKSAAETAALLAGMAAKNNIYSSLDSNGRTGYGLLQVGYGVPQVFFWHGRHDEKSERMANLVRNYFTVPVTKEVYGKSKTKTFKYVPVGLTVDVPKQGVLPHEEIRCLLESRSKIALAHCPCRVSANILGRTDCTHSIEVCFKYDEMAEFVISKGLARSVSLDEALKIMGDCEKEGLVHMVDNARGDIKHTCNCCGHYCWNVGIIRRRKSERDALMAVYFLRKSNKDACSGCGACIDICPVDAVSLENGVARVDLDWCIGCGVCAGVCPEEAISIVRRDDSLGPENFERLHLQIQGERGLD